MKSAFITGCRGFVGRHIARRLYDDGWEVFGVDLKPIGDDDPDFYAPPHDAVKFFKTRDTCPYDLIVHCAAVVQGRRFFEQHPLTVAAADLTLDAELFNWVIRSRTRRTRVIYYSSSAVYPVDLQQDQYCSLAEYDQLQHLSSDTSTPPGVHTLGPGMPDHIYGWVKLTGEVLASHVRAQGIPVHILRPFSGYGHDQDLDYPFPTFIERAQRRDDPFEVWGDGDQVRDFIHIDDIVNATMAAYEQDYREPLNLCTGRPTSFNQLAEMCMQEAGYSGPIINNADAPVGVRYRVGNPGQLHTVYTPTVTLEEGVRRAFKGH